MENPGPGNCASPTPEKDSEERENVFYVSATSQKGFTSEQNEAVRDLTGAPVLCPGNLKLILEKQDRTYQRSLNVQKSAVRAVWTALLDEMEFSYELEDHEDKVASQYEQRGLIRALAILEYGHDYKNDPRAAMNRIFEQAKIRYALESE